MIEAIYDAATGMVRIVDGADTRIAPLTFRNRIYSSDYGATLTASGLNAALAQIGKRISGGWYSVREFGAVGDGVTDDTAAIQSALDGAVGTLYFPPGVYMVSGSGTACLNLTRNLDLIGCSGRWAVIRATAGSDTTSILRVNFAENWGYGNVRNWRLGNMSMEFTGVTGGLHALSIEDGFPINSSAIDNCWLTGRPANGGHGIHVEGHLYYSTISRCQVDSIYLDSHDANTIEKCLVNGSGVGVTVNLTATGVRNTTIRENTFICRSEAIRVVNGSNVRIQNNQCEQPEGALSTSPLSAMLVIEGAAAPCRNVIVSENNFGGGTNLNRLIYVGNARMAVIEKNNLVAVGTQAGGFDGYEVEISAAAERTYLRPDNHVTTQLLNPRDYWAPRVLDAGTLTVRA